MGIVNHDIHIPALSYGIRGRQGEKYLLRLES